MSSGSAKEQPLSEAENARKRRWRAANREHRRAWEAEWRERHRERLREYNRQRHIEKTYSLTPEQYESMLEAQGGKCAICWRKKRLVVDHNHHTGAVRGLLCAKCNTGIGQLNDDPARLRAALRYLNDDGARTGRMSSGSAKE